MTKNLFFNSIHQCHSSFRCNSEEFTESEISFHCGKCNVVPVLKHQAMKKYGGVNTFISIQDGGEQLHNLAILPSGKEPPVSFGLEVDWVTGPVWTRWENLEVRIEAKLSSRFTTASCVRSYSILVCLPLGGALV
jgi:hypothetical protein